MNPAPPGQRSTGRRGLAAGVGVVILAGYVGVTELGRSAASSQRRTAERAAAQRAAVRLSLDGSGDVALIRGTPGESTQAALVRVRLRNEGPDAVELLQARVDGTPRGLTGVVRPGGRSEVLLSWRVRCAEVGTLRGPRRLELQVRVPAGPVAVTLDLPPYDGRQGLGGTFHLAAVDVCDVLVSKEP